MNDLFGVIADAVTRALTNLGERVTGPMKIRLFLQPLMAAFFAIRSGLADARMGGAPFGWALVREASRRRLLLRQGWNDIRRVFVIAILMDVVYQVVVARWVYPGEALAVAAIMAFIPYVVLRGIVTRMARRRRALNSRRSTDDRPLT
jgi:hypothetical protein